MKAFLTPPKPKTFESVTIELIIETEQELINLTAAMSRIHVGFGLFSTLADACSDRGLRYPGEL